MSIHDRWSLGRYLSVAHRKLNLLLDRKLAPFEVTRGELPFLMALYGKEGISQQQLAEFYGLDKGLVARTIHGLEEKDLIWRERDNKDRRLSLVFLTEKGQSYKPDLLAILKEAEDIMTTGLSKDGLTHLTQTLDKIINNLNHFIKE